MSNITVRVARCLCGRTEPSATRARLAFFEARGPGSDFASIHCAVCHYAPAAHEPAVRVKPHMQRAMSDGHEFVSDGLGHSWDSYYCGCRGWD